MTTTSKLHPKVQQAIQDYKIEYKIFSCDPTLADTAAFCEHYGFRMSQSANTIIIASKSEPPTFTCCVVLATTKLDVNKKVRELTGKKGSFASMDQTVTVTGMEIGGVTAVGIEEIPIYIDAAVFHENEIVMGGGNRSTKLLINPQELMKIPHVQVIKDLAISKNA